MKVRSEIVARAGRTSGKAIRRYGVLRGLVLAGWRLLRCNPWSHGGFDYVEDQQLFRRRAEPKDLTA